MSKNSVLRLILTKGVMLPFWGIAFIFCLQSPALGKALIIEKGVIDHDTVWENEVVIKGDVEIAKGATLTVMPVPL